MTVSAIIVKRLSNAMLGDSAKEEDATTTKKKINEPAFLPWVLSAVADQRAETMLEIAEETTLTSTLFFNL